MNQLTQIIIDGRLSMDYAGLTMEYRFETMDTEPRGFRYFFPLPQGGQITGLQMLDSQGILRRAELSSLREEALSKSNCSLVQVDTDLYCLTVCDGEPICRVLVQLLLPLETVGTRLRLTIPMGMESNLSIKKGRCGVQLQLSAEEGTAFFGRSHEIETTADGISAEFSSGKDFVLEIQPSRMRSAGVIQEGWKESVGVYRLCVKHQEAYQKPRYRRVLLLLDTAGAREEKQFAQVRELFLRVLQALPQEMVVQAVFAGAPRSMVLPSFMSVGETLSQILFQALRVCPRGGNLREMLEHLPESSEKETMVILISTGNGNQWHRRLQQTTPIHLFTVGEGAETTLSRFWRRSGQGTWMHFYPEENLIQRTELAVQQLFSEIQGISVIPRGGSVKEYYVLKGNPGGDGQLSVAVRFTGEAPKEFSIQQDETEKERISVESMKVYSHLPMAEQLFGTAKLGQLSKLLLQVEPNSVLSIKRQIEDTSLQYGVLSSETMFAFSGSGGGKTGVVFHQCLGIEPGTRPTVFGEGRRHRRQKEREQEDCLGILREAVRCDGAICEETVVKKEERQMHTAWAVLGLSTKHTEAFEAVRQDAVAYLKDWSSEGVLGAIYQNRNQLGRYLREHSMEIAKELSPLPEEIGVVAAAKRLLGMDMEL